ncbi:ficolin-3-like [Asterias rubens]|uniref:ficolin-3-like n=1 Tax=Asterias rubens TaxID=7604 RepID=UPI001454E656|nr:ficolin-3-like [Asterias rubens]
MKMDVYSFQLFLILLIMTVDRISTLDVLSCNKQMTIQPFLTTQNKQLQVASYQQYVAQSHVVCVSYCHADPQCQSVNYNIDNHLCELINTTRAQYPDDFVTHFGNVYFDSVRYYSSCQELLDTGYTESGIYSILPTGFNNTLQVYCDMDTYGQGWTVIQRRQDGSEDFDRGWTDYRIGFGNLSGEFWLGNDNLRTLTESIGPWKLRVTLEDWYKNESWAEYESLQITGDNFTIHFDSYNRESTAGNALGWHLGMKFSTRDNENDLKPDVNCAVRHKGGWWYNSCVDTNLNGMYIKGPTEYFFGIFWQQWQDYSVMKKCSMMIRLSE